MRARDLALLELDQRRLPGWPPELLRKTRFRRADKKMPEDERDRALAEQIVIGVIKNHLHLRHLISHYAGRSLKSIDPLTQKILSIGLYQLRFLERIPASAAVNEAVEQAKRIGLQRAAGFVNAVLRKAAREPQAPPSDGLANPAGYAELVLSHPRELFEKLATLVGSENAIRICEHNNRQAPTIVRLFSGRTQTDLAASGIEVQPHEDPGMSVVAAPLPVLKDWAERGIAQVQDPTAASVVSALQIKSGQRLLDRCCGLGTKTLQMRDLLGESGEILAVDRSEERCRVLQSLLARRHIGNVAVRRLEMLSELPAEEIRPFDGILIDAPCSNSGVLARRPEARYAQGPTALRSVLRLQMRILDDTAAHLRPGGRLVYSTCSFWPQENERQVAAFIARNAQYRLLEQCTTLPSLDRDERLYHDGGYVALLTRSCTRRSRQQGCESLQCHKPNAPDAPP